MTRTLLNSSRFTALLFAILLASACGSSDPAEPRAPVAREGAPELADTELLLPSLAEIIEQERVWPVRVWLETPLLAEDETVLVPPHRNGVLVLVHEGGRARIDFGRYGTHDVDLRQTNFVSESGRVRRGEATKTHPNLVAMLANRMATDDGEVVMPDRRRLDEAKGGRVLLVFADPDDPAMAEIGEDARAIEQAGDVRLRVLVPVTEQEDPQVHAALKEAGWEGRFVVTPIARSYVGAMLEPGTPTPWMRLCTDEGRILAEGAPGEATVAAIREALESERG